MHRGLPWSKEMLEYAVLDECYPPSSSMTASFSCEKPPMMTVPKSDERSIYKYKGFKHDLNLNHSIQVLLLSFIF
jgi:hypothetical protein